MSAQIEAFVSEYVRKMHPIERDSALAWWNLATTGKEEYRRESERLETAYRELFTAESEDFARIRAWHDGREQEIRDPTLRREVEILYRAFLTNQWTDEERAKVSALEADLEQEYANFRGTFRGRPINDNEILEILKGETDAGRRREAWDAGKQIGARAAGRVLDLVRLRNTAARRLGYRDYYQLSLDAQEIEESFLFRITDRLEALTRAPFQQVKDDLDARLSARWRIRAAEMYPWHYEDPFFQNVPAVGWADLDADLVGRDVAEMAARTYDGMGLDVRDVIARSDLYEREGKSQHAFSTHIDRMTDDVRVLCNVRPTLQWAGTMLHECGHAVYDKYLGRDLPFLLRAAAHPSTTEAIALLMGRQAYDPRWLREEAGIVREGMESVDQRLRVGQVILVRWMLVMIHFERDLYADPDRPDLNRLWWEHVARFQRVRPPEGRDAPDWAAKLHLALAPVYYQNYLLGELIASQVRHAIRDQVPGGQLVGNAKAGQFLKEQLFSQGARRPWNEAVRYATGEALNPEHFVDDFVKLA